MNTELRDLIAMQINTNLYVSYPDFEPDLSQLESYKRVPCPLDQEPFVDRDGFTAFELDFIKKHWDDENEVFVNTPRQAVNLTNKLTKQIKEHNFKRLSAIEFNKLNTMFFELAKDSQFRYLVADAMLEARNTTKALKDQVPVPKFVKCSITGLISVNQVGSTPAGGIWETLYREEVAELGIDPATTGNGRKYRPADIKDQGYVEQD